MRLYDLWRWLREGQKWPAMPHPSERFFSPDGRFFCWDGRWYSVIGGGTGENAGVSVLVNNRTTSTVPSYFADDVPEAFRANAQIVNNPNSPGNAAWLNTFGTRYYTMYAVLNPGTGSTTATVTFNLRVSPVTGTPTGPGVAGLGLQWINLTGTITPGAPWTLSAAASNTVSGFTQPLVKVQAAVTTYTQSTNLNDGLLVWLQYEN